MYQSTQERSANLSTIFQERNLLTTDARLKVLCALNTITQNERTEEEKHKRFRCQAIQEVLSSEVSYLHQLGLILKYFMEPLQQKHTVSYDIFTSLFGNIETLYKVNVELLQELKANPENIAAAFLKLAPFFKLYSVYAYDYKQTLGILQDLQNSNTELWKFIENTERLPLVATKLPSLLIAPIQRVPRYRLLLKQVLAHTLSSHPEYHNLRAALGEVERAAEHINSLVQDYENTLKVLQLQRSLCGGCPTIISPARKFLKEGLLMKVSAEGSRPHPRHCVLFSDLLMYCKVRLSPTTRPDSLQCCLLLPLRTCRVEQILSRDMFKVSCHKEEVILYSAQPGEGEAWVSALREAIKQFQQCRQTLRKYSSSRPVRRPRLHHNYFPQSVTPMRKRTKQMANVSPKCELPKQPLMDQLKTPVKKEKKSWKGRNLFCTKGT